MTSNRRNSLRSRTTGLYTDQGKVIDLSTRGMRLRCSRRWNEGQRRTIHIRHADIEVEVSARCVWCRQEGLLSHTVGLAFDHISAETAEQLESLAFACTQSQAA